jgi:transcriptional regulator with XRE-family HTH domain
VLSHEELVKRLLENPNIKAEYDALEDEFALFAEMIKARQAAGLSQEDVAQKMGTKQAAIARLETAGGKAKHSPSIATLRRYANAIGCHLDIKIIKS